MTLALLERVETVRRGRDMVRSFNLSSLGGDIPTPISTEQANADRICEDTRLDYLNALRNRPYNKWSGDILKAMIYATGGFVGIVTRRKLGLSIEESSYERRLKVDLPVDYGDSVKVVVSSLGQEVSEATKVTVSVIERPDFLLLKPGYGEVWYERFLGRGGAYQKRLRRANLEDARNYRELTSEILSQGR